ncbi:MAG: SOS response-associated peptidase [Pseudomonadota bacterium]
MCGRFAFYSAAEAVRDLFGVHAPDLAVIAQFNIAPTDLAAVVRVDDGVRSVSMLRWGLLPFWAKDKRMASRMINARAETVAEKPAYRAAFRERRCVVPADGYYEWITGADGKQPYYISREDEQPIGFAGLWERWRDNSVADDSLCEEQIIETFTVLTMPSSGNIESLHHRMPVMLDDVAAEHWLAGDGANPPALRELNAEARAQELRAWPVAKTVNNARNESPALVNPLNKYEFD